MAPQLSRRRWLKLSAGVTALFPLAALAERLSGPDPALTLMTEADPLLRWVRQINTTQSAHWGRQRRYAPLEELTPQAIEKMRNVPGIPRPENAEIDLQLSSDRSGYRLAIRDRATGLAYRTDQTGVIHRGTAMSALTSAADFGFEAEPIKRTISGRRRSPFAAPFSAVTSFFVPTLFAEPTCVCGQCEPPGPCLCGGTGCCNIGTENCTWCCPRTCCPF